MRPVSEKRIFQFAKETQLNSYIQPIFFISKLSLVMNVYLNLFFYVFIETNAVLEMGLVKACLSESSHVLGSSKSQLKKYFF